MLDPGVLDPVGRCRWSTNPDEPLLYVKYDERLLNILDTGKKALILKSPVEIEPDGKYSRFFIFILSSSFIWKKRIKLLN